MATVLKQIKLPKNCMECKLYVPIEGAEADYAGIIPRSCALLNVMPNSWGIALERPDFCPLKNNIIDLISK